MTARRTTLLLGALGGITLLGCQRRAPGPPECQRAALQALGSPDPGLLRAPRVRDAFDEELTLCLTLPYDKALLRCLDRGQDPRLCRLDFDRRRVAGKQPRPPTRSGRD